MITVTLILLGLAIALTALSAWILRHFDPYADICLLGIVAGLAAGLCVLFAAGIPTSILLERHYGRIGCRNYGQQSHRQTRFVVYTAFDGGNCLTPGSDGKWIPIENLREVNH